MKKSVGRIWKVLGDRSLIYWGNTAEVERAEDNILSGVKRMPDVFKYTKR
jgi:hypothetical protein